MSSHMTTKRYTHFQVKPKTLLLGLFAVVAIASLTWGFAFGVVEILARH